MEPMVKVLGDEFWNVLLEMDQERQEVVLETLSGNKELSALLLKSGKTLFARALAALPENFEAGLREGFIYGAGELQPSDPRRLLVARLYGNGKFLGDEEIRTLASQAGVEEIEQLISGLSAKQITVFAKALPINSLLNLPNIVKRATVLAQVKSVICAEGETDPKLKEICTTGKWASIRSFGQNL